MSTTPEQSVRRPAWACDRAVLTLRWGRLDGLVYGWVIWGAGGEIAALAGFPVGGEQVGAAAARVWADTVLGPQRWINRPERSGAFHTHRDATEVCQ